MTNQKSSPTPWYGEPCGHYPPRSLSQLHGICIFCWRDRGSRVYAEQRLDNIVIKERSGDYAAGLKEGVAQLHSAIRRSLSQKPGFPWKGTGILECVDENASRLIAAATLPVKHSSLVDAIREGLEKIVNITDGHPIDADRRDRIHEIARGLSRLCWEAKK